MRIRAKIGPDGVRQEIRVKPPKPPKWDRFKDLISKYPQAAVAIPLTASIAVATSDKPYVAATAVGIGVVGVLESVIQDILYKRMPKSIINTAQFAGISTLVLGTLVTTIGMYADSAFGAIVGTIGVAAGQVISMIPAIQYSWRGRKSTE